MGWLSRAQLQGYSRGMPQARRENGPWGEAIQYWLRKRNMRQADLAKATEMRPTTISRIARGFHTQTRVLGQIAQVLGVPLDRVLVSPLRRGPAEDRRQLLRSMMEEAIQSVGEGLEEDPAREIGNRVHALAPRYQRTLLALLAQYEELSKTKVTKKAVTKKKDHASRHRSAVPPTGTAPVHPSDRKP